MTRPDSGGYDDGPEPLQMAPVPEPTLEPPPRPERPVHSVVHEYSWPDTGTDSTAKFAVAFKDGQVRFATAVWVQDGALYLSGIVAGDAIRANLDTVDMESTRKLNAAAGLRWPLSGR